MFTKSVCIAFVALLVVVQARLVDLEGRTPEKRELLRKLSRDAWCDEPIKKNTVNFPESIIGRADVNFDMHSGYVNVTANDFLFYWHFSAIDNNPDAPLVIWTNGGPGCSAMEAATTENGPLSLFDIKESCTLNNNGGQCDYTLQLSSNQYAWNAHANMVYVDQPRFVGNSGGNENAQAVHSSVDAAADFVVFYYGLIELFPEYKDRDLVIAGESYGGHYIPAFAQAILDNNNENPNEKIPLAGAVIGNGCVDDDVQNQEQYVKFLHDSNLIPNDSNPKTRAASNKAVEDHIGYTPNYYDYRLQSITCNGCFGYNYNSWSHWFINDEVKAAMNVCGNAGNDAFAGGAGGCIDSIFPFDTNDKFDYSQALANTLDEGIPVTFYYGKQDTACNYVGGYTMANAIPWKNKDDFASIELSPLEIAGVEVGQTKSVHGLTWLQVEMAGHMVGLDHGAASSAALETIVQKYRVKK
jgi:carboxypeptidase C (cathepsin A)